MPIARIFKMKRLMCKLVTTITLFILSYSLANAAGCIANPDLGKTVYLPVDNIIIQSDESIPVNTVLKSYTVYTYPPSHHIFLSGGSCNYYNASQYLNGWVANANKIVQTNINGIGIKTTTLNTSQVITPFISQTAHSSGIMYYSTLLDWHVDIIKTGPISNLNGQTLKVGELAELYIFDIDNQKKNLINKLAIPNDFRITVASCTTNGTDSYNIALGDWDDKKFKNIGDTSSSVDIPITLSCFAGTNIKVNVTSSFIDNAPTGKLSLTGDNRATGIAIQLLNKNNNPITLNTQWTQQDNVSEGSYVLGWKARYIKTSNIITPGSANASATVNIRYE